MENYWPYQVPPDWSLAEQHGKACSPGKHSGGPKLVCPCCMNIIQKQQVPLSEDSKELVFLGQGFPLFYNFVKFCLIMLGILILDSAILGITLNLDENQCHEIDGSLPHQSDEQISKLHGKVINCDQSIFMNIAYISTNDSNIRIVLRVVSLASQMIALFYFRQRQNTQASLLDQRNCTISNFTVVLKNIPKGQNDNKQKVKELIKKLNPSLEIIDILLIEDIGQYKQKEKQFSYIIEQKKDAIKNNLPVLAIDRELKSKMDQIETLENQMLMCQQQFFCGTAFVLFNSQNECIQLIRQINQMDISFYQEFYPKCDIQSKIKANQAREPRQIIWQNLHYTRQQKYLSVFISWFMTLMLLAIITVANLQKPISHAILSEIRRFYRNQGNKKS